MWECNCGATCCPLEYSLKRASFKWKWAKVQKGCRIHQVCPLLVPNFPQIDFWPWTSRNPCFSLNIPKKEFGALRWLPHPAPDTREADKFENKFSNICSWIKECISPRFGHTSSGPWIYESHPRILFAFYEESIRMCQTLTASKVEKVQWGADLGKTIFQISAPAVCQTFTFEWLRL